MVMVRWRLGHRLGRRLGLRIAAIGGVCAVVLLTLAGVAWAHVTVNPHTAQQGSYTKVSFRVPNERDDASTTQLEADPTHRPSDRVGADPRGARLDRDCAEDHRRRAGHRSRLEDHLDGK